MEEQQDLPVEEQTTVQETTTTPNNNKPSGEVEQSSMTPAQQNNYNAQRRIRQREAKNRRIKELEAELAQYKGKEDEMSKLRSSMIDDRIKDMRADIADEETNQFIGRAEELLGEDTDKFLQDTARYADYINANEPDLLLYAQREYGPILLHEWYKRMDNPKLKAEWMTMTRYEKGQVLHAMEQWIHKVITSYNQKSGAAPVKAGNIPIPGGGRQTQTNQPSDDFGVEFARAEARHKRGR